MTLSVAETLDAHVADLEEERLPDGQWHPSSLFGCERRAVYDFLGTEKEPLDARTKRVFRMGHIFHELLQDGLTAAVERGDLKAFYPEVKIVDPVRGLKGHADGLALENDDTWTVLEFKSIKSTGFKYGGLPKDDHRKQVAAYVSTLRRYGGTWKLPDRIPTWLESQLFASMGGDVVTSDDGQDQYLVIPPLGDLARVRFAYVSKDDLEIKEFEQTHSEQKEQWLDEYLAGLRAHVDAGTLPDRLIRYTETGNVSKQRHYLCGYCPFAKTCWEGAS